MTDNQLMQEVENNFTIATEALERGIAAAKEIENIMESRTTKVINRMFELIPNQEEAIVAILDMGYSRQEICEAGHDVD